MILKRYVVTNMQDGVEKIKKELGSEAVILNTKEIRKKGFKGFFVKPKIEILAAYDDKEEIAIHNDIALKINRDMRKMPARDDEIIPERTGIGSYDMNELENKLSNIDNALNSFMKRFDNNYNDRFANYSKEVRGLCAVLLDNEVKDNIVYELADEITDNIKKDNINEKEAILKALDKFLGKERTITLKRGKPTIVLFIGNTGVGKTTTLSKLATSFAVNKNKKIAVITTDTYKIGSTEQLKIYSEILDVPLSIIYSSEELKPELDKYSDKDIIFIDTGKCHDKEVYKKNIVDLINIGMPDEIYIVVSAHSTYNSCKKILSDYNYIKNFRFIVTKMDEAMSVGTIFSVRSLINKPISYLTYGQVLTEDIEVFNSNNIIDRLIG